MKFRRGLFGSQPRGRGSVVETTVQSTGTDAETGTKMNNIEPETRVASNDLDEKTGDMAVPGAELQEGPEKDVPYGVQLAQATLKVWTKEHLILAYVL